MCVLLVEDEDLIRLILAEVMADAGFDVIDAPDAESALELAEALPSPQVIVSDVDLGPGMNGFAFVAAARQRWPAVPVLMVSGVATNFAGLHGTIADRFLLKPFPIDVFLQNVIALAGSPGL